MRVTDPDGGSDNFSSQIIVLVGDEDGDELLDAWEGLHPCVAAAGDHRLADPDHDGVTNLEEAERGSDPCTSDAPAAPGPVRPLDGDEEPRGRRAVPPDLDLALVVSQADHPDPQRFPVHQPLPTLHYQFLLGRQLDRADPASWQVLASDVPEGHRWDEGCDAACRSYCQGLLDGGDEATASWSLTPELLAAAVTAAGAAPPEDARDLQWRARACDGFAFGDWSPVQTFFYNAVDEPPAVPSPLRPEDRAEQQPGRPIFVVQRGDPVDPERDLVAYQFDVWVEGRDAAHAVATSVDPHDPCLGVAEGEDGLAHWTPAAPLPEDAWYCWQAWGVDDECLAGAASAPRCFLVNAQNQPPTAPRLLGPTLGGLLPTGRDRRPGANVAEVTPAGGGVTLRWSAASDPDGNSLIYRVEWVGQRPWDAEAPGWNRASRSAPVDLGGLDEGSLTVDGLKDHTFYSWRVVALELQDPTSVTPVPEVGLFFVNEANEPPGAPVPQPVEPPTVQPRPAVTCADDPDYDLLSYACELRRDSAAGELVTQAAGLGEEVSYPPGSPLTGPCAIGCVCAVPWPLQGLVHNQPYCFRCRACDLPGGCTAEGEWGPWSECGLFRPEGNVCPQPVQTVVEPADQALLGAGAWPALVVANAVDPDARDPGAPLLYLFEVFDVAGMTSGVPLLSLTVAEGAGGTTQAHFAEAQTGPLVPQRGETRTFYWRVVVLDPLDPEGRCRAVSQTWRFSVAGDTAPEPGDQEQQDAAGTAAGCCGHLASPDPPREGGEALLLLGVSTVLLLRRRRRQLPVDSEDRPRQPRPSPRTEKPRCGP